VGRPLSQKRLAARLAAASPGSGSAASTGGTEGRSSPPIPSTSGGVEGAERGAGRDPQLFVENEDAYHRRPLPDGVEQGRIV